jgi:hypothetical protein
MVNGDQTHWIQGRFIKMLGRAFELFIGGPEDLEYAQPIVQNLAAAMWSTLGKNADDGRYAALVARWQKRWWPTKAVLRRYRNNITRRRKVVSTAPAAASLNRASDITEDPDWIPVERHHWRDDAEYARACPPFLRPALAARLDAIAILRREASETIARSKPQTQNELEQCLTPLFLKYAQVVFDGMAEVKMSNGKPGSSAKAYGRWLRSKCLPAVIDDICRPIFGQFPITVRYLAEIVGDVYWPTEIMRMRQALWGTLAKEVIPDSITRHLENRLSNALSEEVIPRWDATAARRRGEAASNNRHPADEIEAGPPRTGVALRSGDARQVSEDGYSKPVENQSRGRKRPAPPITVKAAAQSTAHDANRIMKTAMDRQGLNPPALAKRVQAAVNRRRKGQKTLKVDRSTVYRIISGETKKPNPAIRNAIIEELKLSPEERSSVNAFFSLE